MPKTIFGREPAQAIGVVEAAVAFLLTLSVFGLSVDTQGVIMAFVVAVGGLYGAWVTSETMLGALSAVVKAGAVLAATYGLAFSDTQQAMLISVITVAIGFIYRTQTSPAYPAANKNVDPAAGLEA